MTGGADADDGFAGRDESTKRRELLWGWETSANADESDVGIVEDLHAGDVVGARIVREDAANLEVFAQVTEGPGGQGGGGVVFILGHDDDEVGSFILGEAERLAGEKIGAGDCWTPVFLDVFDDQVGAGEMIDVRGGARVVHGVGEVAHE